MQIWQSEHESKEMHQTHIGPVADAMYTPAVVAGEFVFTSGQVGEDPITGAVPTDFATEVSFALDSLERVLASAGTDLAHVVKATCFLADIELAPLFNKLYAARMPQPRPARATVQAVMMFPYRVEVECVAVLKS